MDLNKEFYQIRIDPKDTYKLSFITPLGQFEYLRLPFGCSSGRKNFQPVMLKIIDFKNVKIFIDDIIIASDTYEEFIQDIKLVLKKLKEHNATINLDKCDWGMKEIKYLGLIVNGEGIRVDLSRLKQKYFRFNSKTRRDIQNIVAYLNWFRPSIPDLSSKMSKITDPLKANISNKTIKLKTTDIADALNSIYKEIQKDITKYHPNSNNLLNFLLIHQK